MVSRYQATGWQRFKAEARYALPEVMAAVLTVAGMMLAVIGAAMFA